MPRGASAHFFLANTDYEGFYPLVLGVFQNYGYLVADSERGEERSLLKGIPRAGSGEGVEVEIHRKPRGVNVHVLVAPLADFPREAGRFLSREGVFATLQYDSGSQTTLAALLPALRREDRRPPPDPRFDRRPHSIPAWLFFNLKGGAVTGLLGTALGTIGAMYLLIWAPPGPYRSNDALMAVLLVLAPWFSGIWTRSAKRGFTAGFLTVVLPAALYAVHALGYVTILQPAASMPLIDALLTSFGNLAYIAPLALGLLAAIPGAIAGIVGGRIFPLRPRAPSPADA